MSEWIMTQNGAVCKSEVALIIPQDDGKGKKNIVIITKDKIALTLYDNIDTQYQAIVIIDNVLKLFDETHVPQIDLEANAKKQNDNNSLKDDEAE